MPQLDGSFIVNDAFENVMFDLKMIKHSRLFHSLCKVGEEIITLLIKKLVLRNQAKKRVSKKTGINLTDGRD
jgi:hypothetical protein